METSSTIFYLYLEILTVYDCSLVAQLSHILLINYLRYSFNCLPYFKTFVIYNDKFVYRLIFQIELRMRSDKQKHILKKNVYKCIFLHTVLVYRLGRTMPCIEPITTGTVCVSEIVVGFYDRIFKYYLARLQLTSEPKLGRFKKWVINY